MKVFFRNIHLYLSLAAGLVIMIACFTGAVLVFEKELQEAFSPQRYYVEQQGQRQPLELLVQNAKQQVPGARVAGVKVYADPSRTVEISLFMPEKGGDGKGEAAGKGHPEGKVAGKEQQGEAKTAKAGAAGKGGKGEKAGKGGKGGGRPSHIAFMNPYSGQMVELYSYRETFFYTMFALHRWLLGSQDGIGKYIVGVSTFMFLFILVTGIVLWWPKTRKVLSQRLKVKWSGGWKRLNHDFHIVLGFYSAIFLFIFAFTGLSWSFKWFNEGLYKITNSSPEQPEPPQSVYQEGKPPVSLDAAFATASTALPGVEYYSFRMPSDSAGAINVTVLPQGVHESATDAYYLDQYTGQLIGQLKFDDKNLGQRVRSTLKPIHISSIYGMPSKIVGFVVCLLGVTFPITGIILWLNRLRKEKKKKVKKQKAVVR